MQRPAVKPSERIHEREKAARFRSMKWVRIWPNVFERDEVEELYFTKGKIKMTTPVTNTINFQAIEATDKRTLEQLGAGRNT